ncbi:MAG: hypothetical protein IPO77_21665 [Acidobacteria bacterium]|nr:hypothetical protein [Acidobacteriota bacterium]
MSSGLFSVLPTPWSDDFGYLAWRQSIEGPSEAVDLIKPGTYIFQMADGRWQMADGLRDPMNTDIYGGKTAAGNTQNGHRRRGA